MAVTEQEFDQAEKRMTELRAAGHAVSARYDRRRARVVVALIGLGVRRLSITPASVGPVKAMIRTVDAAELRRRSEEHTSELPSLMRISYAVFCLKKKKHKHTQD